MKKFCIMILLFQALELGWNGKLQSAILDSHGFSGRYFRFKAAPKAGKGSKDIMDQSGSLDTKKFQHPFQNPDIDIEARIKNLLSLMTLEEKVACLGTKPNVPRLGVECSGHVEGLH